MNLTLCLTHACGLACTYCYAGAKRASVMSRETAEQAIRFGLSLSNGSFQLGFFGGEPLREWSLLQHATDFLRREAGNRELVLTVTTNAVHLTPERARWLADNGFFLGISIDGNRAMHDATRRFADGTSSFDACARGLDAALEATRNLEVIMVVDPANVAHTADGVRFLAKKKGVPRISPNPNFYTRWDDRAQASLAGAYEALGEYLIETHRRGRPVALNVLDSKIITAVKEGYACSDRCNFGGEEMAVAASGRIYPCERLVGDDTNDEMCIGDVAGGFDERKRMAILLKRGNHDKDCAACALRTRCMNWCGCINYATTGAIDSVSGIVCFHERLAIRVADRVAEVLFAERNPHFLTRFYREEAFLDPDSD